MKKFILKFMVFALITTPVLADGTKSEGEVVHPDCKKILEVREQGKGKQSDVSADSKPGSNESTTIKNQ